MRANAVRQPVFLYVLPHDNCTWDAKLKPNTIGGAVSSAGDTQTETRPVLMTSGRGYIQDIRPVPAGLLLL